MSRTLTLPIREARTCIMKSVSYCSRNNENAIPATDMRILKSSKEVVTHNALVTSVSLSTLGFPPSNSYAILCVVLFSLAHNIRLKSRR